MLNFGSKASQDASLRKIAIWGADFVLCSAPKFGPHPGGSQGGQGGLSFYVGGKGRQWTQISHISHSVVIWVQEPDAMLSSPNGKPKLLFYDYSWKFFLQPIAEGNCGSKLRVPCISRDVLGLQYRQNISLHQNFLLVLNQFRHTIFEIFMYFYLIKMESESEITVYGLKMMMKSGLPF